MVDLVASHPGSRIQRGGASKPPANATVFVAGLRGIPEVQGGIERHCQNLYPRIVRGGDPVNLFARTGYSPAGVLDYEGVKILPLPVVPSKSAEAISHTCLAVLQAKRLGARLLHLHGIGPAIWTPLATRLGLKVVVTHHGFDYRRQKWNRVGKMALRKGEANAIRHADGIICISSEIFDYVRGQSPKGMVVKIPNGVEMPGCAPSADLLARWGLSPRSYLLLTARFVKEKGIVDLIRAWSESELSSRCQLAIAGGEDHPSAYGREVRALARELGAVLTGIVGGDDLKALYGHARGFVLPSYHEGLPISLLEAMSWRLPTGTSDIAANAEVGLAPDTYFKAGDKAAIARRILAILDGPERVDYSEKMKFYDWDTIAVSTAEFYHSILSGRNAATSGA